MIRFKFLIVAFFNLVFLSVYAQEGNYFVSNHNPPSSISNNQNFDLIQDKDGEIWIAGNRGLIRYDGKEWSSYRSESALFVLAKSNSNRLYYGGRGVFGFVEKNTFGRNQLNPIECPFTLNDILLMVSFQDQVLFSDGAGLIQYSPQINEFEFLLPGSISVQGLYQIKDRIFVKTRDRGWGSIDNGKWIKSELIEANSEWIDLSESGKLAVMDAEGNISVESETGDWNLLNLEDQEYLSKSGPIQLEWISENLMAISTLSGGVVFIDVDQQKIVEILNYFTGLPDNEVYRIVIDSDQGVWVLHDYGVSRISPLIPVKDFSKYPGLEGNILSITKYKDHLYAATTTGLFVLDEIREYDEEVFYEKIRPEPPQEIEPVQPQVQDDDQVEPDSTEKKGFFSFFRKKKGKRKKKAEQESRQDSLSNATSASNTEKADSVDTDTDSDSDTDTNQGFFQRLFGRQKRQKPSVSVEEAWVEKVRRELKAVKFVYRKINSIPTKVEKLVKVDDKLFASSLSGAYQINDTTALQIIDIPVRNLSYSNEFKVLMVSAYSNDSYAFQLKNGRWVEEDQFNIDDIEIQGILESENLLWLSSADSVYSIDYSDTEGEQLRSVGIDNPFLEENVLVNLEGEIHVLNSSGIFKIDPISLETSKLDSLSIEVYFLSSDNVVWCRTADSWEFYTRDGNKHVAEFLNIFNDIRYIDYSASDSVFSVVTRANNIYQVDAVNLKRFSSRNSLFLKSIGDLNTAESQKEVLKITQGENSLNFNFIKPDFSGLSRIQYRYRVNGLQENWTPWSVGNNSVSYPFLPPGKYILEAQSRNILGEVESLEPFRFNVLPPYWQRSWFYAVEILVFGLLLYLSIRLNRSPSRFRIVSRLLAFLTLIISVEFIQTIAEYYFETGASPVLSFFIQVGVAFMVLPFERILRKLIFKPEYEQGQVEENAPSEAGESVKA